jgi:hypothetical protein
MSISRRRMFGGGIPAFALVTDANISAYKPQCSADGMVISARVDQNYASGIIKNNNDVFTREFSYGTSIGTRGQDISISADGTFFLMATSPLAGSRGVSLYRLVGGVWTYIYSVHTGVYQASGFRIPHNSNFVPLYGVETMWEAIVRVSADSVSGHGYILEDTLNDTFLSPPVSSDNMDYIASIGYFYSNLIWRTSGDNYTNISPINFSAGYSDVFSRCCDSDMNNIYITIHGNANPRNAKFLHFVRNGGTVSLASTINLPNSNGVSSVCCSRDGKRVFVVNGTDLHVYYKMELVQTLALSQNGECCCDEKGNNVYVGAGRLQLFRTQ